MTSAGGETGAFDLGSFPVVGTSAAATGFRRATGAAPDDVTLPATFPMCWMTVADVRAAILGFLGPVDGVLVHESQTFAYETPLRVDVPYRLALAARRVHDPDRVIVDGEIRDAETGIVAARLETVLRLFAVTQESAA